MYQETFDKQKTSTKNHTADRTVKIMENNTMAYEGFEPYAFISYSHADRLKVERLLRMLSKENKRFWYDAGIRCSDEWEAKINERLQSSAIFILFLSNGVEQRSEVIRELRLQVSQEILFSVEPFLDECFHFVNVNHCR